MRLLLTALLLLALAPVPARADPDPNQGVHFKVEELCGVWDYQDAYTLLPDGSTVRNFGDQPRGYFVINCATGHYSHIVLANDLPVVASGAFKNLTNAEAQAVATNVLVHFGTWEADTRKGQFTVHIDKSSFANFDGIDQVRVVQSLSRTILQYKNLQTTNGPGAVVIAVLRRVEPRRGHRGYSSGNP